MRQSCKCKLLKELVFPHYNRPCVVGAILIGMQLSMAQSSQYRDQLGILWAVETPMMLMMLWSSLW